MVMKLLKSLYGLRQSPRCWYGTVNEHVVEIGFKSLKSGPCVYIYSEDGAMYVLTLYVDDVLLLGKDRKVPERIKRKLMRRFSMTGMGDVSLVLGMEVTRDRTKVTVTITQENYVKSLLERYGMGNCNPAHTPGVGKELSLDHPVENILNKEDKRRFQVITGSVKYLVQVTRYDIGYAVNQLARAMSKTSKAHLAAAKHLLRYLAGTTNFAITYKRGGFKLTAFFDANSLSHANLCLRFVFFFFFFFFGASAWHRKPPQVYSSVVYTPRHANTSSHSHPRKQSLGLRHNKGLACIPPARSWLLLRVIWQAGFVKVASLFGRQFSS